MATSTPVGESQRLKSVVDCSSWDRKESDKTEHACQRGIKQCRNTSPLHCKEMVNRPQVRHS